MPKGVINKDIIRLDNYVVTIDGVEYMAIRVGEFEQPMKKVNLPDGTAASGGRTEASTFEIEIPEHHDKERNFFDNWCALAKDPIPPNAYKTVSVAKRTSSGGLTVTEDRLGCWPENRKSAEMSYDDGAEKMSTLVYTISCDGIG